MLKPKRLNGSSLARRKTVKWELERRFPARYTASNSLRRTSRTSRGNFWLGPLGGVAGPSALLGCKTMTALLAARGKHFAATLGLHARTKPVRLGAPALSRLKCTLWQSNPPYGLDTARELPEFHPCGGVSPPDHRANQDGLGVEFVKPYCLISGSFPNLLVYLPRALGVKKTRGILTERGKVVHPSSRKGAVRFVVNLSSHETHLRSRNVVVPDEGTLTRGC